jgi:hypothetical protein
MVGAHLLEGAEDPAAKAEALLARFVDLGEFGSVKLLSTISGFTGHLLVLEH